MYRLRPRARGGLAPRARGRQPGHRPGPERGSRSPRALPWKARGGERRRSRSELAGPASGRGRSFAGRSEWAHMKGGAHNPVRLRYTKRGKVRWISHRDVARALERAFRITKLPLAFTEGFSPRPKVSFGLALSTGHESEAEYLDLVLTDEIDLEPPTESLTEALPEGMAVTGAVPLVERAPALQEAVTAVVWRVEP